jgi:PPE-repeat protein
MASAAAYEAAFAATVPPTEIAANRALLAQLVATNFLGVNTPAIAATEALYGEMWVQDSTMYAAYQASSTASSALQPVTPLTSNTDPAAAATGTAGAATNAVTSNATQLAAAPLAAAVDPPPFTTTGILGSIDNFLGTPSVLNAINGSVNTAAWWVGNTIPTAVSLGHTFGAVPAVAVSDVMPAGAGGITEGAMVSTVAPMGAMGGMGGLGAAASAGVGQASTVGSLSVPASWSTAAPATAAASAAPLEGSGWTVASEAAEGAPVTAMPGMPGMAAAAKGAGAYGAGPRYGVKPIVMPKQVVV